ncbi:MAG: A24 family peptidase [Alphaproteobacteria bacterium]|nr:A24 family peptidase [Alphaproteobacteria bacterium]
MFLQIFFIFLILTAIWLSIKISVADFRRRIIPDAYLFPLMLIGLVLISFYHFPTNITDAVIGATAGYLLATCVGFAFDYYMQKHGDNITPPIGMGDIKLIGVGGLWLGATGLAYALIIACITGAIWARIRHQKYIPFAPFFLLGGFLSLITIYILL